MFDKEAEPTGVKIDGHEWGFSHESFVEIVEDIESKTGWVYQGDPTLLLVNAFFDGEKANLDYFRGLRINFREVIKDNSTLTATKIAKAIFEFAKKNNEDYSDPVWEVSDEFGRRVLKKGIKSALIAWLPYWLKSPAKEAAHFAVYEIST